MLKEFKAFIMRGNVVDLAVAVILGAAFGAIVTSLVADIITPLILKPVIEKAGVANLAEVSWNGVLYGKFLAAVINFLVVSFCIFLMVKGMNRAMSLRKKKDEEIPEVPVSPAEPSNEERLLMEIRDLLKNK
jgi:large conductance mechanosensitive channel